MGTRGFIGLVVDGEMKIAYNHFDSYPGGVGLQVLDEIKGLMGGVDDLLLKARKLEAVSDVDLHDDQGSLVAMLDRGQYEDASDFPLDSLFAEYGYMVNLDRETFEVYEGFQGEVPKYGLWAGQGEGRYKAVELVAEWSLTNLPGENEFQAAFEEEEAL